MRWIDGLPLANGGIGAVIWGNGAPLIFTLDSYDVWETRTLWPGDDPRFTYANLRRLKEEGRIAELYEVALRRRNTRFTESPPPHPTRLPLGRMEIRWPKPPPEFKARLDLYRAGVNGRLGFGNGQAVYKSFICSTRNVLVLEIRSDARVPMPEVCLCPAPTDDFSRKLLRSWKYPEPELIRRPGQLILDRRYGAGKAYSIVAESVWHGRKLTVFLTIIGGTESEDTRARALRLLAEARQAGVAALWAEHKAEWAAFWGRSAIQLPDSRMENLYYVEQYKHHCSSRAGSLPITLQGLWTTDGAWPPWRGNYTDDLNTEMNYWPVYAANHLADAEPLHDLYWRNLPYYRKLGAYWYGKEIAIVTGEHGPGGEPFPGLVTDEHCPSAGAWIAYHFWLYWLYSQDEKFLRARAYPFMKEMVQGYLHILEKRADGKYHIPFTDCPEFFGGRPDMLGDDTNYDLALLRFLLQSLLAAQPYLSAPDPDAGRWQEILANFLDYPVVPTGWMTLCKFNHGAEPPGSAEPDPKDHLCLALRAGEALPLSHRHHSHLMGIYPLGVIDPERSPAERRLVENSLNDLIFKGTGEWCGMSFTWASLIAGRAGKGRMAHHFLKLYLDGFLAANAFNVNISSQQDPNGICAAQGEPIMTLEAGFGAAAAILEMLLQSQHGVIRLFPACYPGWREAAFFRLRAEGAFLISARMTDRRVRFVEILSEAGRLCRVRNPFGAECVLKNLSGGKTRRLKGAVLAFATKRGGRYLLTARDGADVKADRRLVPLRRSAHEINWFGLKRDGHRRQNG
ncbi:MAG: glycoside hydrolase family 95-like protein [Verrucomicrobiota bacterium]